MKNKLKILSVLLGLVLSFSFAYADDIDGPSIFLKANLKSVEVGEQVKVTVTFSEPILKFSAAQVSVDGGTLESVRKLSTVSYIMFIRAQDKVKYVDVQVEAGAVQNRNKVYNEYSSNNLLVKVIQPVPVTPAANANNDLSKLLDGLTSTQNQSTTVAPAGQSTVQQQVTYVNCYGQQIPSTQTCYAPTTANQNMINTNQYATQPVYDPYTGTYYYPQTTSVNPYGTTQYATSPYTYGVSPVYNPSTGTYYYPTSVTNPYGTYNSGLTPYSTYSTSPFNKVLNSINNTLFDIQDDAYDREYYSSGRY